MSLLPASGQRRQVKCQVSNLGTSQICGWQRENKMDHPCLTLPEGESFGNRSRGLSPPPPQRSSSACPMGPCTMNMGKAMDPRVAITLHPKNLSARFHEKGFGFGMPLAARRGKKPAQRQASIWFTIGFFLKLAKKGTHMCRSYTYVWSLPQRTEVV